MIATWLFFISALYKIKFKAALKIERPDDGILIDCRDESREVCEEGDSAGNRREVLSDMLERRG